MEEMREKAPFKISMSNQIIRNNLHPLSLSVCLRCVKRFVKFFIRVKQLAPQFHFS